MSICDNFEGALMKAIRSLEQHVDSLMSYDFTRLSDEELEAQLHVVDDRRIWVIAEALRRGVSYDHIYEITKIDRWFIDKLAILVEMEQHLKSEELTVDLLKEAKRIEFPDNVIAELTGKTEEEIKQMRYANGIVAAYKMVDTCAAEFAAETPYYYSVYGSENEAAETTPQKKVLVLGSGPIRIGQGIEFDFASVHCVWSLKRAGYEVVIVNNNPETVSTDFNVADRLYFEPLTPEDVLDIIRIEKPIGAVVAFGGQTAIRLTKCLVENNIPVLGTPADSIDMAEDRGRFAALLKKLNMKQAAGQTVYTEDEAIQAANHLGYPVLMRPSYVLGGQNMIIAYNDADIHEYMKIILSHKIENAILIDKYLMGTELEVDAICDGETVLIPGIMEHIERAGVHSGDSIAVYPAFMLTESQKDRLVDYSIRLALSMNTKGLINIQYVLHEDTIYIIEVNPRSSRTVPYISKVTGVPMVDLATRIMMGEKLADMGYETGLYPCSPYYAVKVPVFSFEKLSNVDTQLGPEMKSTGEVLGIARTMEEALFKGLVAAGYTMKREGGVLISVRDTDKSDLRELVKEYVAMGFHIYATSGTASRLNSVGISSTLVKKPKEAKEGEETTISLLEEGKISYVISTSKTGRQPGRDSVRLRRKAVELGIPCLTSLDTAAVLALTLESQYNEDNVELVDIAHIAHGAAARKELSQMEKPEEIQIPGYVLQEHEND